MTIERDGRVGDGHPNTDNLYVTRSLANDAPRQNSSRKLCVGRDVERGLVSGFVARDASDFFAAAAHELGELPALCGAAQQLFAIRVVAAHAPYLDERRRPRAIAQGAGRGRGAGSPLGPPRS